MPKKGKNIPGQSKSIFFHYSHLFLEGQTLNSRKGGGLIIMLILIIMVFSINRSRSHVMIFSIYIILFFLFTTDKFFDRSIFTRLRSVQEEIRSLSQTRTHFALRDAVILNVTDRCVMSTLLWDTSSVTPTCSSKEVFLVTSSVLVTRVDLVQSRIRPVNIGNT